jgi:hypothetical protein
MNPRIFAWLKSSVLILAIFAAFELVPLPRIVAENIFSASPFAGVAYVLYAFGWLLAFATFYLIVRNISAIKTYSAATDFALALCLSVVVILGWGVVWYVAALLIAVFPAFRAFRRENKN